MRQFDTCFFERYAKVSLTRLLGNVYADLLNEDRPDLQSPDHKKLGIEVTRAMEESKDAASHLLKEMAGIVPCGDDLTDMNRIIESGYGYGLQNGKYIGTKEYDYWALALPLKRIIESKVRKAANGFYGRFDTMGLYVFCKDDISEQEVIKTCTYICSLQEDAEIRYDILYLSEISNLFVCDLGSSRSVSCHPISADMRRDFFIKSL